MYNIICTICIIIIVIIFIIIIITHIITGHICVILTLMILFKVYRFSISPDGTEVLG
jgi:hypothetical protein